MKNKTTKFLALLLSLSLAAAAAGTMPVFAEETSVPVTDTETGETTPSVPDTADDPADTASTLPTGYGAGWQKIDGKTYYFDQTETAVTGWQTIDGSKYYFGGDGVMSTLWRTIDGNKYYFGKSGVMRTGWRNIEGSKYYFGNDGIMSTMWRTIDGNKYYFGKSGVMRTGWRNIDSKKYYFGKSGVMRTGWRNIDGSRYYFGNSGVMRTGWRNIDGGRYYFGNSGVMRTGFRAVDGKKYYFDSKGVMQKNMWRKTGSGDRYYFKSNGAAATGWPKISGYRYYFSSKGVLDEDVRNRSDVHGPYKLIVSLSECTVIVLAKGNDGVYDIPAVKFVCSPGKDSTPTPTGTFTAYSTTRWQALMGPSWGQYGVHVVDGIYFHSIPCGQANVYNVPYYDYYSLGTKASHGCIRLLVRDEKWIYDHAKNGIEVTVTKSTKKSVVSYLTKPKVPKLQQRNGLSWDPTDPIAIREQGK